MSGRFVRASKYRHVFGKPTRKESTYDNLHISRNAWDTNLVKVNPEYISVNWEASGGGAFAVIPLNEKGRLPEQLPLFRGHTAPVLDTDWNPFNDRIIASGSDDGKVFVWQVPENFTLYQDSEEIQDVAPVSRLTGHQRKVGQVLFNPAAENILASASGDYTIKIWDIGTGESPLTLRHKDIVQSLSWSADGKMMVTTSRDKKLRVWDVRQERPAHEVAGHTGAKNSRAVWMGEHNRIATTGFSKMSDRQMALWDVGNPSEPIGGFTVLDSISGVCMPFWDDGTNCLYLAGKGDGNIRYFEYENDKFEFLSEYKSGDPQRGLAFMPRRGLDVHENEVMRAFKTVNDTYIEPISFVVPRRAEVFQADIFPPAIGTRPGVTAKEWLAGETRVPAKIDLEAVYEGTAPKEVPTDFHPPKEAPPANAAQVKHTAPVAAKRGEPVATPTLQKAPVSVAEQKGSISAMASKFQDKEAEESEDDESESSFEEISRPAPRQSAPAQVASAVAKTGAAVVNAAKSAAQPLAAASPLPTKTTSAPSPKPAAAPISSPVSSPAPSSSTIPPSLESSLEQIKTLLQQQTSIISAQSDKIALLTAEVETLKQRVAGTSLETDRKMDELKEVVKVEIKEGVEGVMKVVS